jgi:hypothetical protein
MGARSFVRSLVALVVVALGAATAWAQDYTVTTGSGQWITPPASASTFGLLGDDATQTLTRSNGFPAFDIQLFGKTYTQCVVSTNGFLNFGNNTSNGCCSPQGGPFSSGSTYDGVVSVAWSDLYGTSGAQTAAIKTWTQGVAPDRIFVLAWTNWSLCCSYNATINAQVQFYENGGRIQMAYTGTWTAGNTSYGVGIDEQGGSRWVNGAGNGSGLFTFSSSPSTDYRFDPKITTFTGNVYMDAAVADQTGFGNSFETAVPAVGLTAELRNSSGSVLAAAPVDANGQYVVRGTALDSTQSGSIHVTTRGRGARVSPSSTAATPSMQIASSVTFGTNQTVPSFTIGASNDSNLAFRKPAQVALAIGRMDAWVRARTTDAIGVLEVYYDDTSTAPTAWTGSPASLRIGGASSGNQDAFDAATVMRGYGRHVLRSMTGATTNSTSLGLNTRTDSVAAAADGLGAYVYSRITGSSNLYDATSTSTAAVFDLENPTLTVAKGPDVGGWFAAAMYDLTDPMNEPHDLIDGTGTAADRPFAVLDALTTFSMPDFVTEWYTRGYDAASLVKVLVHHGVLADDSDEPNDGPLTARNLGTTGVRLTGRTLNSFNEDWFLITPAQATDSFFVDVVYDRSTTATVVLEVIGPTGILATGSFNDATGPLRAVTPPIAANTELKIRVAHVSGGYVGTYALQAYGRMFVGSPGPFAWTVGRPLNQTLLVSGGIPPFTIVVKQGTQLPPGIALDAANARVVGTPLSEGSDTYQLITTDAADPANTHTATLSLQVNDVLNFSAPLLTGIAVGKPTNVSLGQSGGTPPIAITNFVGDLPAGLDLTDDFRLSGTSTEAGGGRISFVATDVAGSTATVDTTLVACAHFSGGKMALDLGAGDSAAGFYFDAIAGTTANVSLSTAKKRAQRDLTVLLVGPDGRAVESGTATVARGRVQLKNAVLPISGRYFFVLSSLDGGPATALSASLNAALPKKGGGEALLDFGDSIEFQFGALDGTQMTLQGKTTLGMEMRVVSLYRPDGSLYPAAGVVEHQGKGKFKFTMRLDQAGTWRIILGHKPGPVGEVDYTYTFKQPKGRGYSAD